jgi:hypothetical protein
MRDTRTMMPVFQFTYTLRGTEVKGEGKASKKASSKVIACQDLLQKMFPGMKWMELLNHLENARKSGKVPLDLD